MSNEQSRIFAGIIPSYILSDPKLSQTAKLLYGVLAGFAANQKTCFANNKALAAGLCIEPRQVRRCLRELIDQGHCQLSTTTGLRQITLINSSSIVIDMGGQKCPGGRSKMTTLDPSEGRSKMTTISTTTLKGTLSLKERECTQISKTDDVFATVKDCPLIRITEKEKEALKARYKQEGLSLLELKDGCELFNQWLFDNPRKADRRKSHYRCLIGWVLKESLTTAKIRADKQSADLRLERSKQVLKTALPGENPHDSHARKINEHRARISGRNNSTTTLNGSGHSVGNILKTLATRKDNPSN